MMSAAFKKAIQLLARREYSRQELYNKLHHKGLDSEDIKAAIERLSFEGLLNDERFAESYVRRRAATGFGPLRIAMELKTRGVSPAMIDQVLWSGGIDWTENCRLLWIKKYNKRAAFGTKMYAAQLRFLLQRGYDQDMINPNIS